MAPSRPNIAANKIEQMVFIVSLSRKVGKKSLSVQLQQFFFVSTSPGGVDGSAPARLAVGEFGKGLDLDIVIDGLYGSIYYRLLVPYADLSNS
ncbi:MAG TPA: hypothetical protein VK692_02425 [Chthoniobacterales bacterium]|nr:hypothetical protein [Chthoniobacterales bacterium]